MYEALPELFQEGCGSLIDLCSSCLTVLVADWESCKHKGHKVCGTGQSLRSYEVSAESGDFTRLQ